ncbi:MAG: DUF4040 domain-containing protein [Clostridia bacterium]|nr:DUF4040 domain-containing protein [Eubacteriales bacterium]NCC47443.1 DUF4040 domain-containing protein [Clostridia bacterium]
MVETFFLMLLLVTAFLTIQQRRLRTSVIFMAVFSLLSSVVFLLYQAPDVAMAEIVIGSTLSTVLYLVALSKQERLSQVMHLPKIPRPQMRIQVILQRLPAAILTVLAAVLLIWLYPPAADLAGQDIAADWYRSRFQSDTGAGNAVAAIYLNYRVYDTLFETLTLLISVLGVVHLSRYAEEPLPASLPVPGRMTRNGHDDGQIITPLLRLLLPLVMLTGFYIMFYGHLSPGGGFQGGAILSSVLFLRYLTVQENDLRLALMQKLEKILFLLIILVPALIVFITPFDLSGWMKSLYLITMNLLIGVKVCFGLSVIFIRFVFHESR